MQTAESSWLVGSTIRKFVCVYIHSILTTAPAYSTKSKSVYIICKSKLYSILCMIVL